MARKRTLAAALATVGYLQVAPAWSLGLGEITLQSFLNEPLRASVSLINTGNLHEDQIRVRLATSDDFDRLGVERAYFLTGIKFEVSLDQQGNGQILLTSEDPVLEPYLDFIVEARWPAGRLLRNYTVLVDPPGNLPASRTVSASEQLASEAAESGASSAAEQPSEAPEAVSPRGDRVDLRASELAQGSMPRRPYSADTAELPEPGARYMIRRDETLWTIAQRARPEGASVQQTMLEIQRLNPDAFIDGNINRIKAGYIIYLPDSGDMSPADVELVREQIRQQNADWRAGRSSDPEASSAALRLASGSGDRDDLEAAPETAPGAAASREESSGESGSVPGAIPAPQDSATAASLEELEQASQERDELSRQLASLGERLASLERMVEMRDAQIAELQAALAEAQARPVAAADSRPSAAEESPEAEPQSAQGSNTWWYALGGAALAGLIGLLLWRRRQQPDGEEEGLDSASRTSARGAAAAGAGAGSDAFAGVELRDQDVELDLDQEMAAAAPTIAAPRGAAGPERGYGERKHDQYAADVDTSDALAEADIYVAYGRFPQAMELLRKAISTDPGNPSYRLRLLELAVETGNREEAEQQLEALRGIDDADSIEAAENLLLGGAAFDHREPATGGDDSDLEADMASAFASAEDLPGDERRVDDELSSSAELPLASGVLSDAGPDRDGPSGQAQPEEFLGNLSDFGRGDEPVEDLSEDLPDLSHIGDGLDEQVPAIDQEHSEFLGLEIEDADEELDLTRDSDAAAASDEDDFVFADDGDPIATKLDLARAYIDMGDEEGAREILEEVLGTGNSEQQQDATELLDRLG